MSRSIVSGPFIVAKHERVVAFLSRSLIGSI